MIAIVSLVVIIVIGAVVWWFLRKILHIGFLLVFGLLVLAGWWLFFVR